MCSRAATFQGEQKAQCPKHFGEAAAEERGARVTVCSEWAEPRRAPPIVMSQYSSGKRMVVLERLASVIIQIVAAPRLGTRGSMYEERMRRP